MIDSSNTNNDNPNIQIGQREVIHGIGDSLLVGLSFYFGFLITSLWSRSPGFPYYAQGELVLMSLGAAFSYAFVFVYRWDRQPASAKSEIKILTIPFWNITFAYLLHLSILFLVKDAGFSSVRGAVGLGYMLGFLSLSAYMRCNSSLKQDDLTSATRFIEIYRLVDPTNAEHRYMAAIVSMKQGNKEEALKQLEEAFKLGFKEIQRLNNDPVFESLHSDQRFNKLLAGK